jgi:hypothetical protein
MLESSLLDTGWVDESSVLDSESSFHLSVALAFGVDPMFLPCATKSRSCPMSTDVGRDFPAYNRRRPNCNIVSGRISIFWCLSLGISGFSMNDLQKGWSVFRPRNTGNTRPERFGDKEPRHVERETLYISGPDENSSTIISYNSLAKLDTKLNACTYSSRTSVPEIASCRDPSPPRAECILRFDDVDLRRGSPEMSIYDLSRLIISRFLSANAGTREIIRIYSDTEAGVIGTIYSVLFASSIIPISGAVLTADDSRSLLMVLSSPCITSSADEESCFATTLIYPSEEEHKKFVRDIVEQTITNQRTAIVTTSGQNTVMCSIFWALGVMNEAVQRNSQHAPLGFTIFTDGSDCPLKLKIEMSANVVFGSDFNPDFSTEYIPRFLSLPGSAIEIEGGQLDIKIKDVFLGGYTDIYLRGHSLASLAELLVQITTFVRIEISFPDTDIILLRRQSTTIDPLTKRGVGSSIFVPEIPPSSLFEPPRTISEGTETAQRVLEAMGEIDQPDISVSVVADPVYLTDLFSGMGHLARSGLAIEIVGSSGHRRVIRFRMNERVSSALSLEAITRSMIKTTILQHPEPVSRPFEMCIRLGCPGELEELRVKLLALFEQPEGVRLCLLMLNPRNIGIGIRQIAETGGASFEFISERAVKDPVFGVLKNAARLFISVSDDPMNSLEFYSALTNLKPIEIAEIESRVTIATRLFAALTMAAKHHPNEPFVLLHAANDHCIFIGLMAIVVVNGWAKAAASRVETRVTDNTYFVTRLIPYDK